MERKRFKDTFSFFNYVCVWGMYMEQQVAPEARRGSRLSRAVVTDDCEPPDMGAGS